MMFASCFVIDFQARLPVRRREGAAVVSAGAGRASGLSCSGLPSSGTVTSLIVWPKQAQAFPVLGGQSRRQPCSQVARRRYRCRSWFHVRAMPPNSCTQSETIASDWSPIWALAALASRAPSPSSAASDRASAVEIPSAASSQSFGRAIRCLSAW